MFLAHIGSYEDAVRDVAAGWPTRIVSLLPHCGCLGAHHLVVEIDDICDPQQGYCAPAPEHLDRVLAFTRTLTDNDRLLVHCRAGVSRSTAMIIAIFLQHGMDPDQAFSHVRRLRPEMILNRRILELADARFRLGGRLVGLGERECRRVFGLGEAETRRP